LIGRRECVLETEIRGRGRGGEEERRGVERSRRRGERARIRGKQNKRRTGIKGKGAEERE